MILEIRRWNTVISYSININEVTRFVKTNLRNHQFFTLKLINVTITIFLYRTDVRYF